MSSKWRNALLMIGLTTFGVKVAPGGSSIPPAQTDPATYPSTSADRREVTVTVYNQNFGLVREVRDLTVPAGRVAVEYADVASHIEPQTVHIRATDDDGFRILEQNYRFDLLNPQKLLEKYVGRSIKVYRRNGDREAEYDAEVLSVNQAPVLRIGDEITYNFPGRFAFPEIPDDLIARPTLVWLLEAARANPRVEVSYLTQNLNWQSDYVLVVRDDDTRADLTGWVTLTNQTGATYDNARLKLVAGDVQRVGDTRARVMADAVAQRREAAFQEESFFEYHLYTLDRPTTLRENEQKQVTLLEGEGIGLDKRLIYYGAAQYYRGGFGQVMSNSKVGVYLDFANHEDNNLGMPLPRGVVRVYKADREGAQQFIGEDRIDHTPRGERIRIKMGEAFDVVGDRRQTAFDIITSCVSESAWEVTLRNHKDDAVTVEAIEPVGGDWELLESTTPARTLDAHTFAFDVEVPARGATTVRYRVRVRWC